jgi:hypothetical protein
MWCWKCHNITPMQESQPFHYCTWDYFNVPSLSGLQWDYSEPISHILHRLKFSLSQLPPLRRLGHISPVTGGKAWQNLWVVFRTKIISIRGVKSLFRTEGQDKRSQTESRWPSLLPVSAVSCLTSSVMKVKATPHFVVLSSEDCSPHLELWPNRATVRCLLSKNMFTAKVVRK